MSLIESTDNALAVADRIGSYKQPTVGEWAAVRLAEEVRTLRANNAAMVRHLDALEDPDVADDEVAHLRARAAVLEGAVRCTCDYAGMAGEPHKDFCEIEGGPHAECKTRVDVLEQELGEVRQLHASAERLWYDVSTGLRPLCACGSDPASYDGPQRECVLHGDGDTFVAYVQALETVARTAVLHAADLENGERIVKLLHALDALGGVS